MPHAEIKYSSDLQLDSAAILAEIETIILRKDGDAPLWGHDTATRF